MLADGVYKYKTLSLAQQYSSLQTCPLSAHGHGQINRKYFYWEFTVQPTPLSKTYQVLIIFHKDNFSPDVFVLDHDVWDLSKIKTIPHLYDHKKIRLCLYYPSYNDWDSTMSLCTTFVPWTYLWLYYFEEWQYSGEWKGGGVHPENQKSSAASTKKPNISSKFRKQKIEKPSKSEKARQLINSIYEQRKNSYVESKGQS